ncbi:FAD-dependent oxidoreductase [Aquabacterium sp. A7-Y]|uniref:FAD-dependent oxidoreductase n=1 Tax=Aquabacterium sp. A7-Y TaxID=1349605 RepID=UPI00223D67BE|nr:FAD-dependent oxidoreductase [Aquabacterium sp. A7-Y]MCW7540325.1 FAD-dependent oxidoreductase [Aquabacterium sp. A7-Y]
MHIAIIGAGIAGVTAAHALAAQGHRVTVFERRGSVAAEASFAHLGLIAPSGAGPGSFDATPPLAERGRWGLHPQAHLRPGWDAAAWRWLWQARQAAAPRRATAQKSLGELARYGRLQLLKLVAAHRLEYERADGHLVLLCSAKQLDEARQGLVDLKARGVEARLLDAAACRALEPGLQGGTALAGGLHFPQDEVGNCRQFAHLLKEAGERAGVEFRFCTEVTGITSGPSPALRSIELAETTAFLQSRQELAADSGNSGMEEHFDAVMLCAGAQAAPLLRQLGLRLPLLPIYGYTITATLRDYDRGPRSAVTDAQAGIGIARLGHRVRVSGGIEIGTAPHQHHEALLRPLYEALDRWFPGAAHTHRNHAQAWKGASPTLPDGLPVLGASVVPGIWLNLGHGTQGWALACGAARLLADRISGRSPDLALGPFEPARLQER